MKQNLFKTLLLAATLLVGGANCAWATDVPYNVGASTSDAWGTAFSDVWTLTEDGAVTVTFTNHCATDGNWWDNWQLLCGNSDYTPSVHDNANRYFQMRSDSWDDAAGSNAGFIKSDDYFTDFKSFQNDATVTLKIVRSGTTVTVNVSVTKSATTRNMTFVKTGLAGTLNFFLVQSLSYMEITQQNQTTEMAGTVTCNALMNFDGATITSNTINGGLGTMSWSNQWTATPSIDSDMLRVGNMNDGTVALIGQPSSKDIVTISFDLGLVQLSGRFVEFKVTDKNGLVLIDEEVNMYNSQFSDGKNTLGFATGDFVSAKTDNPGMNNDTKNKFTLTFNYVERKISCSVINKNGTVNKQIDMPAAADALASFAVRGNYNNANRRCYFDNLLIQTEKGDYNTTANVTLAFKDNEDNEISALYTGITDFTPEKGSTFSPSDYYPAVMYDSDYKYTYTSGGDDFEVTSDAVVELVYTKSARPTHTVTVTANYGGNNKTIVDGVSVKEASDYTYFYPRFIKEGNTLYEYASSTDPGASASFWTSTTNVGTSNVNYTLTYNALDGVCVYYAEGEEVSGATPWEFGDYKPYMSNGYSGAITSATTLINLDAGEYAITACAIGRQNDRFVDFYKNSAEDENRILTVTSKNQGGVNTANFSLTGATNIVALGGYAGGSSGHACDYIYIMQTAKSLNITSAGWATLYTPYGLDFSSLSSSFTAYTATVAGSTITLNPVTEVPANTGVVLNGDEGRYNIPVITSSTEEQGALTGNAAAATAYDAFDGYTLYALAQAEDYPTHQVQFRPVTEDSIAAGKAFLKIANGSLVKAFDIDIAGVDAIDDVTSKMEEGRSEIFNLAGQRMNRLQKGVNIVNGKKILVK